MWAGGSSGAFYNWLRSGISSENRVVADSWCFALLIDMFTGLGGGGGGGEGAVTPSTHFSPRRLGIPA